MTRKVYSYFYSIAMSFRLSLKRICLWCSMICCNFLRAAFRILPSLGRKGLDQAYGLAP